MKKNTLHPLLVIFAMTTFSACSSPPADNKSQGVAIPAAKVAVATPPPLIGSFTGLSASCEGGTSTPKEDQSTKLTVLTFNADGTYKSVTNSTTSKAKTSLESEGTFSIADHTLTLVQTSSSSRGKTSSETSFATYQLEGNSLTLDLGPSEDGSCPANQALITKYQRQQAQTAARSTTPSRFN